MNSVLSLYSKCSRVLITHSILYNLYLQVKKLQHLGAYINAIVCETEFDENLGSQSSNFDKARRSDLFNRSVNVYKQ